MNKKLTRELVIIYDRLIQISKDNQYSSVQMEWGTWVPTENSLRTLQSRRDKIVKRLF
tara:strand:+ start:961 stop:1134 length:174 start_codon:yes stop_codon:yes gene_type:complete